MIFFLISFMYIFIVCSISFFFYFDIFIIFKRIVVFVNLNNEKNGL